MAADKKSSKPQAENLLPAAENFKRADVLYRAKLYEAAIAKFNEIIQQTKPTDSFHSEAYFKIGNCYVYSNDIGRAIHSYNEAIRIDPSKEKAFINLGTSYEKLGQAELAISCYEKAIKINPRNPDAYLNLTQIYKNLGKHDLSIFYVNKLLNIDPNNISGQRIRGELFNKHKSLKKLDSDDTEAAKQVIDSYKTILMTGTDRPTAYRKIGDKQTALGNYDEAFTAYKIALDLDPNDFKTYCSRGILHYRLLRYYDALADFNTGIQIQPDEGILYLDRCNTYMKLKEIDLALADTRKALECNPAETFPLKVLKKYGKKEEIIPALLAALNKDPVNEKINTMFEETTGKNYQTYQEELSKLTKGLYTLGFFPPELNNIISAYTVTTDPDKEQQSINNP